MTNSTSRPPTRNPWWIATVSGMASYLDSAAIITTGTALVLYQSVFDLSAAAIGQVSALLTIMIAIGALVGGRTSDQFGRRRVFVVTMVLYAIGAAILTAAVAPWMLYLGVGILGFGVGADLPASIAMISENAASGRKGKMVAYSHTLWIVGILVTEAIGFGVGDLGETGARILYAHLLVVAVAVLVARAGLPESETWTEAKTASIGINGAKSISFSSLRELFGTRYVWPLLAISLFYALVNIAANTNGQFSTYLYVNAAGSSVSVASFWSFVGFFLNFIGMLTLMRFVDTKWRVPAYLGGFAFAIVGFLIPALAGVSVPTLVIMGILFSIGGAVSGEPLYKVWSQELFPTRFRSSAVGISTGFTRAVAAVVALFTPGIIDGGPTVLFITLAAATLIGALMARFWIQRLPVDPEHASDATDATATVASKSA